MANRSDILFLIIIIVSLLIILSLENISPLLGTIGGIPFAFGIWLYAAYWGFNVRRALAMKLYRNQALGIGLIAIALIPDAIAHALVGFGGRQYLVTFSVIEAFVALVNFYFIDASVLVGRRSDPLLRDTLHWGTVRLFVWPAVVAVLAGLISFAAYFQTTNVPLSLQTSGLFGALFGLTWLSVAVIVLPITAYRSKDPRLHLHFAWYALYVGLGYLPALFGNGAIVISTLVNGALLSVGLLFWGYALYKSARALVPLNRISPSEISSKNDRTPP